MSEELGTTTAAALGKASRLAGAELDWQVNPETPCTIITPNGRISISWKSSDRKMDDLAEMTAAMIVDCINGYAALVAERDALKKALGEVHRRTGLLMHQNMGRWNMSVEHDKRTYEVLGVNQIIALAALEPQP